MPDFKSVTLDVEIKDPTEGRIEAIFSTFDVVDADGDVVKAGAIPEAEVPIIIGHDWSSLPVGKGRITANRKRATIDGQFFMSTEQGRNAFETIKAMGKAQQYSWGFEIIDSEFGEFEGKQVRFIKQTRPFEVSAVIAGSNPRTETLLVKDGCPYCGRHAEPEAELKAEQEESAVEQVADQWQREGRIRLARARIGMDCA